MKRALTKNKRDFSSIDSESTPIFLRNIKLEEYEGYRLGEKVWFNTSILGEKYSWGIIKQIEKQPSGSVSFSIWDEIKCMWRSFSIISLYKEKPLLKRKPRRKK